MAGRKKAKGKTRTQLRAEFGKRRVDYSAIAPGNPRWVRDYYNAIQDLHVNAKDSDLKKAALEYAKAKKMDLRALKALEDRDLRIVGKYSTVIMGGGKLPHDYEHSLVAAFGRLQTKGLEALAEKKRQKKEEAAASSVQITVQDRIREQVHAVTAVFDEHFDALATSEWRKAKKAAPDPAREMQAADFKAVQANQVSKLYQRLIAELAEALEGKDEQLKEGYSVFSNAQLKAMHEWLVQVTMAAEMVAQAKKAARKPRKKKAVSLDKQVEGLKFCKMDTEYNIASINPVDIIGARELWVFNTKYRKLGRYIAMDESGLGVKGASIIDYSEDNSREKTLRKPKEQLAEFSKAGKVKLRKFLDEIKSVDTKLKGRLNPNVVLLRVVK